MTCDRKNMQELLPAYLAGTLGDEERIRIEDIWQNAGTAPQSSTSSG